MKKTEIAKSYLSLIPPVHKILNFTEVQKLMDQYGQPVVVNAIRRIFNEYRNALKKETKKNHHKLSSDYIIKLLKKTIILETQDTLIPILNLSGIILHSNFGRAILPKLALKKIEEVLGSNYNIEYDIETGKRSDREIHIESKLCSLLGAEAVTIVNNNAAAVMLVLNTLARRKEVIISRGELIEIGGSFRLPDIMQSSNCILREIATTNITNLSDYEDAINTKTGLIFKTYSSNFTINGYTKSVDEKDLVSLSKKTNLPLVVDLGSGAIVDLSKVGLKFEPTPYDKLKEGVDLVTFSGDKLMGGPQCGIIAGRADLIKKIKKNAMKRAMRCDKFTIVALSSILKIYQDPKKIVEEIPTLRFLARPKEDIKKQAERVFSKIEPIFRGKIKIKIINCFSQMGSGTLPNLSIPSVGISFQKSTKKNSGLFPIEFAQKLRKLPTPIIGRIKDGALVLDFRCLEKDTDLIKQLQSLKMGEDL